MLYVPKKEGLSILYNSNELSILCGVGIVVNALRSVPVLARLPFGIAKLAPTVNLPMHRTATEAAF